jgi:hypothetical protein
MRRRRVGQVVRAAVVLLLGFLLLASGCLDTPGEPPVDDVLDAVAAAAFALPAAKLLGPGADAESSIDVSPDGQTILVCTHGGFTQPSPLWASTDAGASFKRIEPGPNQPFNGDCDISIAPDGAWVIVYDTVASATVAVSTDKGATWRLNPITGFPIAGLDRPWIHALSRTSLYMTYKSVGAGQPEVDMFAASTDGGISWIQKPYWTPAPPGRTSAIPGDLYVSDGGKTIRVPFIVRGGQGSARILENALSRDGGTTWTTEPIAGNIPVASGIPGGARAADGTLYFSYGTRAGSGGKGDVMAVWSHDDGKTWSKPSVVAAEQIFGGLIGNVWIDARPDGTATLFWVLASKDANGTTKWQHQAARINVTGGLVVEKIGPVGPLADPHASNLYEFATVRHDAQGRAHFAFPAVTGASCKQTPAFPSQVGSQQIPRNTACQYVVIED